MGTRSALQQRHEVLKTENPGGESGRQLTGLWEGDEGAGLRAMPSLTSLLQMPLTCRGGSCWLAWTRWSATWTDRRKPSQGSFGHLWSRAALCRTALNGLRPSRYLHVRVRAHLHPCHLWSLSLLA